MDTSAEFAQVVKKKQLKAPVSYRDVAVVIANSEPDLVDYLVANDPDQVYSLLNRAPDHGLVIGENAGFIPSADRAKAELLAALATKDYRTANYVLRNFKINMRAGNWTVHPKIIESLKDIEAVGVCRDCEGDALRFKLDF
ncbi:MAG TPA: hypothetical protein VEB40_01015 [Flavipsychrobacter sp.]|nr:hypothetical protein [Flavipsychrobacter sp.]